MPNYSNNPSAIFDTFISLIAQKQQAKQAQQKKQNEATAFAQMTDIFDKTAVVRKPVDMTAGSTLTPPPKLTPDKSNALYYGGVTGELPTQPEATQEVQRPATMEDFNYKAMEDYINSVSMINPNYGSMARQIAELKISELERNESKLKSQADKAKTAETEADNLATTKQENSVKIFNMRKDGLIDDATMTKLQEENSKTGTLNLAGITPTVKAKTTLKPQDISEAEYINKHSNWASIASAKRAWKNNDDSLLAEKPDKSTDKPDVSVIDDDISIVQAKLNDYGNFYGQTAKDAGYVHLIDYFRKLDKEESRGWTGMGEKKVTNQTDLDAAAEYIQLYEDRERLRAEKKAIKSGQPVKTTSTVPGGKITDAQKSQIQSDITNKGFTTYSQIQDYLTEYNRTHKTNITLEMIN